MQQLRCVQKTWLLAVFVLGGMFVGFLGPAFAGGTPMAHAATDTTSGQTLGCYKQGCEQRHATCERHCVSLPERQAGEAVFPIVQDDVHAVASTDVERVSVSAAFAKRAVAPDRAPPRHRLLRSIVKRE